MKLFAWLRFLRDFHKRMSQADVADMASDDGDGYDPEREAAEAEYQREIRGDR